MGAFQHSDAMGDVEGASSPGCRFPADFGPDEIEFATELRARFSPEREDLPPLYVQTLAGDGRYPPIEANFEQKVTCLVFRRLGLERRGLFEPLRAPSGRRTSRVLAPVRRVGRVGSVVAACAAILMLAGVMVTGPSFAAGVRILLGHTGVQPVASYPAVVLPSTSVKHHGRDSIPSTPLTQVDWLGTAVDGYVYQDTHVNVTPPDWSNGPVVEMLYQRPGSTPGSGMLDVREFRLSPAYAGVLQVVADGSATSVMVGDQPGVYVDGRWVHTDQQPGWEFGVKSELIFERDGLIFWIVADQRDGTKQAQLVDIAARLQSAPLQALAPNRISLRMIGQDLQGALRSLSDDEVYQVFLAGSSLDSGEGQFVVVQLQKTSMR
jgi:hypothetical protein